MAQHPLIIEGRKVHASRARASLRNCCRRSPYHRSIKRSASPVRGACSAAPA